MPAVILNALDVAGVNYDRHWRDPFAAIPNYDVLIGTPFKVQVPLTQGRNAFWIYDDGKLKLGVSFMSEAVGQGSDGLVTFSSAETQQRGYVGSNAFGATRRVGVYRRHTDGVAFVSKPEGADKLGSYGLEIPAAGPQAKALTRSIKLIVEGKVTKLSDGHVAACGPIVNSPTFDAPYDSINTVCFVGAVVTRVAFVNTTTGETLKEWSVAKDAMLKATAPPPASRSPVRSNAGEEADRVSALLNSAFGAPDPGH